MCASKGVGPKRCPVALFNFDPDAFETPLLYDQRNGPGFLRVVNGRIDIGAFESKHP